jgi:hypothetical protein
LVVRSEIIGAERLTTESAEHDASQSDSVARPAHNVALGYLRGFLVVLVVVHHSVLAYINLPMLQAKSLLAQPRYWRAFMVIDPQHSTTFTVFTSFNDIYFMSLMFFVSGLFVWSASRFCSRQSSSHPSRIMCLTC